MILALVFEFVSGQIFKSGILNSHRFFVSPEENSKESHEHITNIFFKEMVCELAWKFGDPRCSMIWEFFNNVNDLILHDGQISAKKNFWDTTDIQRMQYVYNSWVVRYAQAVSKVGAKMSENWPKTISNGHLPVDSITFSASKWSFFNGLVTFQEAWLYYYDQETKHPSGFSQL